MTGQSTRPGILVLDKPRGVTSHDVVMRVRRALATREVGHAGTLDPMATGVLVVAVGEATKLVPWLTAGRKSYTTTVLLGIETDTLDAAGRVVGRSEIQGDLRHALQLGAESPLVRQALDEERRRTSQLPPAYSAIHTEGERAYAKARRGEAVDLAPREVEVHELTLVASSADPPSLVLDVEVSKGFYVRALARDLAGGLGTVGHLTELRRSRAGAFGLEEAAALEAPAEQLASRLVPLAEAAARTLPVLRLTATGVAHARSGRPLPLADILGTALPGPSAWVDDSGTLVAVGEIDDGHGRVIRGFRVPGA
jgi:tRNA pseudouridine55 synthase